MSPAELVIDRFGSARRLALLLGCNPSAVCRWPKPKPRGLGGTIPSNLHLKILTIAKQYRIKIKPEELIFGDEKNI